MKITDNRSKSIFLRIRDIKPGEAFTIDKDNTPYMKTDEGDNDCALNLVTSEPQLVDPGVPVVRLNAIVITGA
jgi:hypothetical protein